MAHRSFTGTLTVRTTDDRPDGCLSPIPEFETADSADLKSRQTVSAIYNFVPDESLRQITLNSLASVICGPLIFGFWVLMEGPSGSEADPHSTGHGV